MITVRLYTGMRHEVDTSMKESGVIIVDIVQVQRALYCSCRGDSDAAVFVDAVLAPSLDQPRPTRFIRGQPTNNHALVHSTFPAIELLLSNG